MLVWNCVSQKPSATNEASKRFGWAVGNVGRALIVYSAGSKLCTNLAQSAGSGVEYCREAGSIAGVCVCVCWLVVVSCCTSTLGRMLVWIWCVIGDTSRHYLSYLLGLQFVKRNRTSVRFHYVRRQGF